MVGRTGMSGSFLAGVTNAASGTTHLAASTRVFGQTFLHQMHSVRVTNRVGVDAVSLSEWAIMRPQGPVNAVSAAARHS